MPLRQKCASGYMGGITIEDDLQIGPRVNLITENYPVDPSSRKDLDLKFIPIKRNAWIGARLRILLGVTVGENFIVAAGALINRDLLPIFLKVEFLLNLYGQSIKYYLTNLAG